MILVLVPAALGDQIERDGSDSTKVDLSVKSACEIAVGEYALPSGGVIGIGRTGSLFARVANIGSFEANIERANFTVSRYNRTLNETQTLDLSLQQFLYNDYEPLADFQNYTAELGTEGASSFGRYVKAFTASTEYPTGTYNATISFNATCFRGPGLEPLSAFDNKTKEFSLVKSEVNEEVPTSPDRIGEAETDEAIPKNFTNDSQVEANPTNFTGDARFEANQTANFSEDGRFVANETLERPGDNPNLPGVSANNFVEIQPLNRTNIMPRGANNPVRFEIRNLGDRSVPDLIIEPNLERFDGWESDSARIGNLTAGSTVNRTINVRPPESAEIGTRIIPVEVLSDNQTVDLDFFYADVVRAEENRTIEIVESPPAVNVEEGESRSIPVLVRNTGGTLLTNITAELENHMDCVNYESSPIDELEVNNSVSLPLSVDAQNVRECEANLIVSTDQGATDFADILLAVNPEDVLIPERQGPPILAIVWTLVLALYAFIRKRLDWESITAELPLILLIMGETVIILYLAVGYFGFISLPFLPF